VERVAGGLPRERRDEVAIFVCEAARVCIGMSSGWYVWDLFGSPDITWVLIVAVAASAFMMHTTFGLYLEYRSDDRSSLFAILD